MTKNPYAVALGRKVEPAMMTNNNATTMNDETLLTAVRDAIVRLYDMEQPLHIEYPGFIAIPECIVNDDTDGSTYVWCIGPGDEPGEWSGQLMTDDGSEVVDNMSFVVVPKSQEPDEIAAAVYCHGIGDLYLGGGCSDVDCPRKAAH